MILDVERRKLRKNDVTVNLTGKEFGVVEALARASRIMSHNELINAVWGLAAPDTSYESLKVMVHRVRVKAAEAGLPKIIESVYGHGFVLSHPIEIAGHGNAKTVMIPEKHRTTLVSLLYSHPDKAAADRVLASFVGR